MLLAMLGADDRTNQFCIIGAGPAGLAMAAAFRTRGIAYEQLERHDAVGGVWDLDNPGTPMYASAHLVSSRTKSGFIGFPMPENYPDYPRRDQVLSYLRAFAAHHDLLGGIQFGHDVQHVSPHADGVTVTTNGQQRVYRGVVCASGLNWQPLMPVYPGEFAGELRHSITYKHPSEFEGKRVVIVGLGNSAADIACDAVHRAKSVVVSTRRGYHFIPKFVFGKPADVFASEGPHLPLWLEKPLFAFLQRLLVGDVTRLGMPKPDHALLDSHPLVNDQLLHHLHHGDVTLRGRIRGFSGNTVAFEEGPDEEADLVLLATGYTRSIAYVDAGTFEDDLAASNVLSCFHPRIPHLFTLGFAELNGALYPHLSRLSALIAHVAHALRHEPAQAQKFQSWVTKMSASAESLDTTGGRRLIDTPRHQHYFDDRALTRATTAAFGAMGWPCP